MKKENNMPESQTVNNLWSKEGIIVIQRAEITDSQVQVFLTGSIYSEEARQIQEKTLRFIEHGHRTFSFDLSEVDYIDSTGLGVFVSINKQALKKGGSMKISGTQGMVKEIFEMTRLSKVLGIE